MNFFRMSFIIFSYAEFIFSYKFDYSQENKHKKNISGANHSFKNTKIKNLETVEAVIGQLAILPCYVNNLGSFPVIWVKNGDILSLGTTKINNDNRLSIQKKYMSEWRLIIENITNDDEGEYICKTNGNFYKAIRLEVLSPPSFDNSLSTSAGDIYVEEESEILLKCYANAKPVPLIKWFSWKKYENFETNKKELNFFGNSLLIPSIKRNDDNMYECIAKNTIIPDASRIFNIRVQFLAIVNLQLKESSGVLSQRICLECKIEANPIEKIIWYKNDTIVDIKLNEKKVKVDPNFNITHAKNFKSINYDISSENEFFKFLSIITIRDPNQHNFMEYKCCVENYLGTICSKILVNENQLNKMKNSYLTEFVIHYTTNPSLSITNHKIPFDSSSDSKDKRRHFLINSKKMQQFNKNEFNYCLKSVFNIFLIFFCFIIQNFVK